MPVGETLQAALLGLVQGLTEFLPISSSGHLLVVPWLLGWTSPLLNSLTFDVALHLGTLGAVIVYFRREWWALAPRFDGTAAPQRTAEIAAQRRLAWLLVLGSVPAGLAGLLADEVVETLFRHPIVVAAMLVVVGVLMWVAELHYVPGERTRSSLTALTLRDAVVVGMAQATALIPGVSRSGITIVAGLTTGLSRETAARFSFLLGAPVIAGAGLLKIGQFLGDRPRRRTDRPPSSPGWLWRLPWGMGQSRSYSPTSASDRCISLSSTAWGWPRSSPPAGTWAAPGRRADWCWPPCGPPLRRELSP